MDLYLIIVRMVLPITKGFALNQYLFFLDFIE